jgi:hypothetical protein
MHPSIIWRRNFRLGLIGLVALAANPTGWAQPGDPAASAPEAGPGEANTRVVASFERPGTVDVAMDLDLTSLLASPEAYRALSAAQPAAQREAIEQLLPEILRGLQLQIGHETLQLVLQNYALPSRATSAVSGPAASHFTTLRFLGILPASHEAIRLIVPPDAKIKPPVDLIVQIPSAQVSETSRIDPGATESAAFAWADSAPQAGSVQPGGRPANGPTFHDVPPSQAELNVETMPWSRQLPMYLKLGFHHIVPEGTDHILFVLGLFFLGITWRKLLFQTSVFTVAHATTLFLSTYGIFSLPSKYVEPAIALSIAFIALENVFNPRLGWGRLAVVFSFGLIHGLGFASSLSEVPFPKHQFIVALLGFNFGVDFGQLFIICLAFLIVGWWRNRPWFRARIAIPSSLVIAAIGIFWAIQRIVFYSHSY